jgi:hypothetical protein
MKPRYDKLLPRKRKMKETKNNGQIPFDNNPRCSGLINYASNGVVDMYSAFQYGFKVGWQTCWHEQNESNKRMKETMIYGSTPYGALPKRTPWTIFTATIWLMWWDVRLWLANRGLFVKKIYYDEPNL